MSCPASGRMGRFTRHVRRNTSSFRIGASYSSADRLGALLCTVYFRDRGRCRDCAAIWLEQSISNDPYLDRCDLVLPGYSWFDFVGRIFRGAL